MKELPPVPFQIDKYFQNITNSAKTNELAQNIKNHQLFIFKEQIKLKKLCNGYFYCVFIKPVEYKDSHLFFNVRLYLKAIICFASSIVFTHKDGPTIKSNYAI